MVELVQNPGQEDAMPLVTVAMPIYNAGRYLRLAVLSIIQQTFTNWELLIIDDGSTDNALPEIADLHDPRIKILSDGTNQGLAARLNEAIDLARGQYLARMDQDDVSYPERFARQVAALNNEPDLDLVGVRAITINENNEVTGLMPYALNHEGISARPWQGFYFPHPTWMGRIEWFRKHSYTIPGPFFCEDQELLLRSYRESRFGMVDKILFGYRIRSEINWKKLAKTRLTILAVQLRHFIKFYRWDFLLLSISVFVGRIVGDFLKLVTGGFFLNDQSKNVDISISAQWHVVLNELFDGHH